MNVSFSNLQLLPAFPHVEIHLESSRDIIFTLLHVTSHTVHSLQECEGLKRYLTSVIADSPKQSTSTYLWDCRNPCPLTLPPWETAAQEYADKKNDLWKMSLQPQLGWPVVAEEKCYDWIMAVICSLLCYKLLKQSKEGKRGDSLCLVFLEQ